jgi:hypothetical protein
MDELSQHLTQYRQDHMNEVYSPSFDTWQLLTMRNGLVQSTNAGSIGYVQALVTVSPSLSMAM